MFSDLVYLNKKISYMLMNPFSNECLLDNQIFYFNSVVIKQILFIKNNIFSVEFK